MAYAGWASHTKGWQQRYERSMGDIGGMLETAELCRKSGLNTSILSGGSTGTYNIDTGKLTELQCGSYVFMDTGYMHIGSKDGSEAYHDFVPALTVMTTVISRTRDGMCTIDAGNKAMLKPTDEVRGRKDIKVENQGAEYGLLLWKQGPDLKLGERVELYPTNLDTSTNVYDRYYVARGENIIDVWPIMGRAGAAQR
jgi:D-serine deaminase-like pyridoxal phosphate-dependent protein